MHSSVQRVLRTGVSVATAYLVATAAATPLVDRHGAHADVAHVPGGESSTRVSLAVPEFCTVDTYGVPAAAAPSLAMATAPSPETAAAPSPHTAAAPSPHTAATLSPHTVAEPPSETADPLSRASCIALDALDAIADADTAGLMLRPSPNLTLEHGHNHGTQNVDPVRELNETRVFEAKGPVPLSYVEWDYAAGLGQTTELRRFTGASAHKVAETWPSRAVIGASGGYWRTLADIHYRAAWDALREDIRARAQDTEPTRYATLFATTAALFLLACFVLLPLLLALQAAASPAAPLAAVLYLGTLTASLVLTQLYFSLAPALYPPNVFLKIFRGLYVLSVACFALDALQLVPRAVYPGHPARLARRGADPGAGGGGGTPVALAAGAHAGNPVRTRSTASTERTLASSASSSVHEEGVDVGKEKYAFTVFDQRDGDDREVLLDSPICGAFTALEEGRDAGRADWSAPRGEGARPERRAALWRGPRAVLARWPRVAFAMSCVHTTVSRGLVPLAFAVLYVGTAIYTGSCRKGYKNVCLAHGIKGGVFFWYGILTYGRYLGAFGEYGWAWNRRPTLANSAHSGMARWRRTMPSAEFIECFVIFLYGVTNTWMERFGAKPGDPYTVKQVQHISIAVMFWFVGLAGMGLESARLRALLARTIVRAHPAAAPARRAQDPVAAQTPPPSYAASFNPFPALVIGVTGVAMAAHHQDYEYEVEIHTLWGIMLAAFSMFRVVTYTFLWLRPPTSVLPSRPPSEALASFSLCCGGLLFMLSNEEVSFAAMRSGYDDGMAMLNVAVAAVALIFCWGFGVMVIKAWAQPDEVGRSADAGAAEEPNTFVLGDAA
ncbi:hypothetical protein MSPP1_002939 [Malassezia sp. CBS 17886]|nr:hypothetical protein MSPP1_002939 [Malassezia sp. CBS 17886]